MRLTRFSKNSPFSLQNDFAFFHELHEELFGTREKMTEKLWDIPLITVDAELPKERMFQIIDDHLHEKYNRDEYRKVSQT